MFLKELKKSQVKRSKNGTIFYIDKYGDNWCNCEPYNIVRIKYNQYLIDKDGIVMKISEMNKAGYEYSVFSRKTIETAKMLRLHDEKCVETVYQNMIGKKFGVKNGTN